MEDKSWVIYGLREDREGSPLRYVGYTTKLASERLRLHKNDARKKSTPVGLWIKSLDYKVTLEVIEVCPQGDMGFLMEREVYWIESYRLLQGSLQDKATPDYIKNHQNGGLRGAYGTKLSDEHREAIRAGVQNHFKTNGHKAVHDFWIDKYGKDEADRMLVEYKARRSVSMSGSGNSMFGRSGQDAPCYGRLGDKHPMYGTHHSEEAKKKISDSTKGRPKSIATKVRMSLANHRRFHNEKVNQTCKWCLGADLQTEIDKAINEAHEVDNMG